MQLSEAEKFIAYFAAICTGGLFLWKAIAGWLVVNVSIAIETERQTETEKPDILAFKIIFKKGNTDTSQIKDKQARVYYQENGEEKEQVEKFSQINKLYANTDNVLDWKRNYKKGKKISLSPNESFILDVL